MDPDCPLIVPEVNAHAIAAHKNIIANPNCTTILMNVPVYPLHMAFGVERAVVSTYQAASGAGLDAMNELEQQARDWANGDALTQQIFGRQYIWNLFSHNSPQYPDNGYNEEEWKMVEDWAAHMAHSHTAHLPLGALLSACTVCGNRKGYCATRGALPHRAPCPRCTAECMHRVGHRKGYCATTSGAGNCSTDAMGSWPIDKKRPLRDSLRAATEWCLAQCAGCARCRFISVSARWSDCSWFERCSLDGLHRDVLSFRSGRAPSARTSLSSWPVL